MFLLKLNNNCYHVYCFAPSQLLLSDPEALEKRLCSGGDLEALITTPGLTTDQVERLIDLQGALCEQNITLILNQVVTEFGAEQLDNQVGYDCRFNALYIMSGP